MSNAICVKPHHYSQQSKYIVRLCEHRRIRCIRTGFFSIITHTSTDRHMNTLRFFLFFVCLRAFIFIPFAFRIHSPHTHSFVAHDSAWCMRIRGSRRQHKNARQTEINSMIDTISISHSGHTFTYRHIAVVHSFCFRVGCVVGVVATSFRSVPSARGIDTQKTKHIRDCEEYCARLM